MQPIRFCLDEHVAHAVATGLRRRGIEVQTVSEAEMRGASDEDRLGYIRKNGLVIVTHDNDFLRFVAQNPEPPGIVYMPRRREVGFIVKGLTLIAQVLGAEGMRNHIEFL